MEKLRMGTAYHGNRILKHVREDMEDIARHNMNLVVHMFTHTDWERHLGVMKDIVSASRDAGLMDRQLGARGASRRRFAFSRRAS